MCLEWHRGIRRTRNDFNESPTASSPPLPPPSQSSSSAAATTTNNKSNTVTHKNKDNYTNLAQLAAWGLPALQTGAVLVARLVDADELFGEFESFIFIFVLNFVDCQISRVLVSHLT